MLSSGCFGDHTQKLTILFIEAINLFLIKLNLILREIKLEVLLILEEKEIALPII
tara:strand:- start:25 stop:189 length:165 start_codon:yes stop_codon:yes gene_type:complete